MRRDMPTDSRPRMRGGRGPSGTTIHFPGYVQKFKADAAIKLQDEQNAYRDAWARQQAASGYGYGGGGYGYGGGGGGGYQKPDTTKIQAALAQQRDSAINALPGYLSQYNAGIKKIGTENAALTKGYGDQINGIMRQLQRQAGSQQQMLQGDIGSNGGDMSAINAQANQDRLALSNMAGAGNAYNLRLAQIMGAATADRQGMGAGINQASRSGIDQNYMQALMQILGMG